MTNIRRKFTLILSLVLITGVFGSPAAQAKVKVKVLDLRYAYMMNIIQYITWPETRINPVVNVCVVGKSPFSVVGEDNQLHKTTGYITVTKYYEQLPELADLQRCKLIYFAKSITLAQLSFVFSKLKSLPIVTIGEHRGFLRIGGLLKFNKKGKRLRFEFNKSLLNKTKLKIHPSLLRLSD